MPDFKLELANCMAEIERSEWLVSRAMILRAEAPDEHAVPRVRRGRPDLTVMVPVMPAQRLNLGSWRR